MSLDMTWLDTVAEWRFPFSVCSGLNGNRLRSIGVAVHMGGSLCSDSGLLWLTQISDF